MSYFKYFIFAIVSLVSLAATAEKDAINTGRFNSVAIKGYDSVAYFELGKPTKGSEEFSTEWRGATWLFANTKHLELFKENTEKYAPQYGGWCAYAMSDKGRTVRIDPAAWYIHQGRLYLNYSKSVQQAWLEDRDKNIEEADFFYPQTTNVSTFLTKSQ